MLATLRSLSSALFGADRGLSGVDAIAASPAARVPAPVPGVALNIPASEFIAAPSRAAAPVTDVAAALQMAAASEAPARKRAAKSSAPKVRVPKSGDSAALARRVAKATRDASKPKRASAGFGRAPWLLPGMEGSPSSAPLEEVESPELLSKIIVSNLEHVNFDLGDDGSDSDQPASAASPALRLVE